MPTDLKQLPLGTQSFAELRTGDCVYVDKTADIHRLVTTSKTVFLSRPRRFGKTLLLSTLAELFKGNEALFRGLAIHDKWNWEVRHPVIQIEWTQLAEANTLEEVREGLARSFTGIATAYDVQSTSRTLKELIEKLHNKTGQRVVVLVDEYDKLVLDALNDKTRFDAARDYLNSVYIVLKAMHEHIRFIFITGVSKFAGVSVFSGLNNLNDITLNPRYATICGYTQNELEENFADYIEVMSKVRNCDRAKLLNDMRTWYNGYSWDGETSVYNPHSILYFFELQRFGNFWFQTGTPSFLLKLAEADNEVQKILDTQKVSNVENASIDLRNPDWASLLFQTGYLTIKKIREVATGTYEYTLAFPNTEVRRSFYTSLLAVYLKSGEIFSGTVVNAMQAGLANDDVVEFEKQLRSLLAKIPYSLTSKEKESHYHVITILWLHLLGFRIDGEVPTDKGRIDAVLELPEQTIIIEVKLSRTGKKKDTERLLNAAFAQIKEKGYADAYMSRPGKVSQLALVFYNKEVACKLEVLKEK